jgi:hypothetical protein
MAMACQLVAVKQAAGLRVICKNENVIEDDRVASLAKFYVEYLSFTMAISVSPRYPSQYLYSIHTCACDLLVMHLWA